MINKEMFPNLEVDISEEITEKTLPLVKSFNFVSKYTRSRGYDFDADYFKSDYERLINGLDSESVKEVDKIVDIYKSYNSLVKKHDVTLDEIYSFQKKFMVDPVFADTVRRDFFGQIKQTFDGFYVYKNYVLSSNHFEPSVFYHRHSIDELKTLDKIRDKDIIDVGGFIGDSALVFSKYTDKKIYSFEASADNLKKMKKNITLNHIENIEPVYCALGEKDNEKLCLSGQSSMVEIVDNSEDFVLSRTLDSFAEEKDLDIGLIKVDIEGFEQSFLKGAEKTIKSQKPALLISIYHKPEDYLFIKPIIESWNLGYTFRIICPPENKLFETLLVAEVPKL